MDSTLLMLADGRFPAGGHAHSGGLEAAVAAGRVTDLDGLAAFLTGRLATAGHVTAAFAAAAHHRAADPDRAAGPGDGAAGPGDGAAGPVTEPLAAQLALLDAELDARTAAPALRLASRRQGKALARAGRAVWPSKVYAALPGHPDGPQHPITLGVVAAAAGLTRYDAAVAAAYGTVTAPASAAVRLLGLDPYRVQAVLARLARSCDTVAATGAGYAAADPADLPSGSAPLADVSAQLHATWEVRLFAS